MDKEIGKHTVDRFASRENRQLPRYNAKWRDGTAEAVDPLHLTDHVWQQEVNWCNPQWSLLDDLDAKLRQLEAASIVIAPKWPSFPWYQQLAEMTSETV